MKHCQRDALLVFAAMTLIGVLLVYVALPR